MKLSNQQIIAILNVFDDISSKDLPVDLAFDLYSLHAKLLEVYSSYIRALSKKMEKEGVDKPEELSDMEEVNKLLERRVEIDATPIERQKFIDSGCKFTLAQVHALSPIIDG